MRVSMKTFSTAGPVKLDEHYNIPALARWDMDEIRRLIREQRYFVLHVPRQTGKTSCLLALMERLNAEAGYARERLVERRDTHLDQLADKYRSGLSGGFRSHPGYLLGEEALYQARAVWKIPDRGVGNVESVRLTRS